jgi:hypothetical protein
MGEQMWTSKYQDYMDQINKEMGKGRPYAEWTQPGDFYKKKMEKGWISQDEIDFIISFLMPLMGSTFSGSVPVVEEEGKDAVSAVDKILEESGSAPPPPVTFQSLMDKQREILGR